MRAAALLRGLRRTVVTVLLVPVHLWRATAPLRTPRCRFHPSCSTYAVVALRRHGPLRGSVLAARRLGRCHPWNPGGIDHVPPASGAADPSHPARIPSSRPARSSAATSPNRETVDA